MIVRYESRVRSWNEITIGNKFDVTVPLLKQELLKFSHHLSGETMIWARTAGVNQFSNVDFFSLQ
jgi:hypothetical protein